MEQLHRFGKDDAIALDETDGTGAITLECRDDVARGVVKPLQGLAVDLDGAPAARPSRLKNAAAASVVARPGCHTSVK